ncbi:magnesium transporter [Sporosarcina limicola]|uniref:SLC41A/MgtE integral membrane domain-containing protein n=1 Tax=Sporosarcina limicola TaxID=34101 RepID=A0A927MQH9_9BACL|nr:magnesium transporter [Sporosarcina limicola]MBE1557112.1 hypothetical protein [Sporosarcina limicola]
MEWVLVGFRAFIPFIYRIQKRIPNPQNTIYQLKIDPTVASGPFITTINDIVAIGVYFSVASILFFYM